MRKQKGKPMKTLKGRADQFLAGPWGRSPGNLIAHQLIKDQQARIAELEAPIIDVPHGYRECVKDKPSPFQLLKNVRIEENER